MTTPLTIDCVDIDEVKARLAADDELILRLLVEMVRGVEADIGILSSSTEYKNVLRTRRLLHKLLGAAGNISAGPLFRATEAAGKQVHRCKFAESEGEEVLFPQEVNDALDLVFREFQRLKTQVSRSASSSLSDASEAHRSLVGSKSCKELERALSQRDFSAIDALEAAERDLKPIATKEHWFELESAVDELRFGDALSVLHSIERSVG